MIAPNASPTEKKISLCEKNDILISKVERENPGLLHAKAGMVLAEEAYGVKDPQILHAIKGAYNRRAGYEYIG